MGRAVSAGRYLSAIETLQRYSRRVAAFFVDCDVFLNPTMSLPPVRLGEMVSTADDPLRGLEVSSASVAYSAVIANITGQPAMSVPLHWNDEGLPIGMHFLGATPTRRRCSAWPASSSRRGRGSTVDHPTMRREPAPTWRAGGRGSFLSPG